MSTLSESQEDQAGYLNQVLAVDPGNDIARSRLAKMAPPAEEEAAPEAEEEAPAPPVAETVVGAAAVFEEAAEEATEDVVEEAAEEPVEEVFEEAAEAVAEEAVVVDVAEEPAVTMIGEAEEPSDAEPSAEEMAMFADWLDLEEEPAAETRDESLDAVVGPTPEVDEADLAFDEWDATMIQPVEEVAEAAGELDDTMIQPAVSDQDISFEEQAAAGTIPAWLAEEGDIFEDETRVEPQPVESKPAELGELPDWLMEGPDEDWIEPDELDDEPVTEVAAPVEPAAEAKLPEDVEAVAPKKAPAKRKKSSTRGLEILLLLLIIIAVVIVGALVYLLLNPI
jgi:hypothetical protein